MVHSDGLPLSTFLYQFWCLWNLYYRPLINPVAVWRVIFQERVKKHFTTCAIPKVPCEYTIKGLFHPKYRKCSHLPV